MLTHMNLMVTNASGIPSRSQVFRSQAPIAPAKPKLGCGTHTPALVDWPSPLS